MTTDYDALIKRLEEASGPDRELDAAITVAVTQTVVVFQADGITQDDLIYLSETRHDDDCAPGTYWYVSRSGRSLRTADKLTDSIDAALALVERKLPGWRGDLDVLASFVREGTFGCRLFPPASDHNTVWVNYTAEAATSAIAILIALLRALKGQGHD